MKHRILTIPFTLSLFILLLAACEPDTGGQKTSVIRSAFELSGVLDNPELDEISGIESAKDGRFYVHNDEGKPLLHVIDRQGRHLAAIKILEAKNRDWEDITSIPRHDGRLIAIGDVGDNQSRYRSVRLYFIHEPVADASGKFPEEQSLFHWVKLHYPDGPRDCEAIAYDAGSDQILFMTKRDSTPRLYGISAEAALTQDEARLTFLAEVPTFTPPTRKEILLAGKKAFWLSQPTGMDFSDDGKLAAVITYRSTYLFFRDDGETWAQAFQKTPSEFYGPPGVYEEAVVISDSDETVYVTTERVPTPLYKMAIPEL